VIGSSVAGQLRGSAIVTLSAVTDTTGKGTVTLRLRKQDPVGTYRVGVTAAVNGAVFGTASTTFSV
jgi:hypothetical protein